LAEQRKNRSARQKLEMVLAGMRGDRSVRDVCREHDVAEALYYSWRDKILEGGRAALAGKDERQAEKELRRKIGELERGLGRKTYELDIAEALRGRERGSASPGPADSSPVAASPAVVGARDADQPPGDPPHPEARPAAGRRPATGTIDRAIIEVARANPTDGTRMVAALTSRGLERPISRKRAQR